MTRLLRREDIHTEVYGAHNRRIYGNETNVGDDFVYVGTYPTDADTTPDSPPFQGGWTNTGLGRFGMRFCWVHDGDIKIQGSAKGGIVGTVMFTLPGAGMISATTLNAGGSGYAAGDIFLVSGAGVIAAGAVDAVSSGVVTDYHIINGGSAYTVSSGVTTTARTGVGTGLKINITVIGYDEYYIPQKELWLPASTDLGLFIPLLVKTNGDVVGGV